MQQNTASFTGMKPTVFIASNRESVEVARALQLELAPEAEVILWSEVVRPGITVLESLTTASRSADFAVVVLSSDDKVRPRGESWNRIRENVLFEAGMVVGALGPERTIFLMSDRVGKDLPSDLSGIFITTYNQEAADTSLRDALAPAATRIRQCVRQVVPRRERFNERYSCFISYSAADAAFVEKLRGDLKDLGVTSWMDTKDIGPAERWQVRLEKALRSCDKVLLVLSKAALGSKWVQKETELFLDRERTLSKTILFPIGLDDAVIQSSAKWVRRLAVEKEIRDFRDWPDQEKYQREFARLVRRLTVTAASGT